MRRFGVVSIRSKASVQKIEVEEMVLIKELHFISKFMSPRVLDS
jgi:hypothetical protein